MKRWYTLAAAIVLIQATMASAQTFRYGWTVSKSDVDPFVNTGAPTGSTDNLYLWFHCSVGDGLSAADIAVTGSFLSSGNVLAFNVMNGFLNAGTATALLLAVGGCPPGPVVAGAWLILHTGTGDLCLGPGLTYPTPVAVDCSVNPAAHPCDFIGYSDADFGAPPCEHYESGDDLCETKTAVEESSWGTIKSLYR
jgi:hypothetical protein